MEKIFCSSLSWCERSHYVRRLVSKSVMAMVYSRTRECGKVKLAMRASARSRCQSIYIYLHLQFIFSSFLVRIVEKEEEKN